MSAGNATRTGFCAGLVLAATVALAGCQSAPVEPMPTTTAQPSVAPVAPTLDPEGSASDNIAYFDSVNATLLAANPEPDGRTFVDSLAAAGFTKTEMEVTFDATSVDLAADSLQFSVRFAGECLLGQHGPSSGGYHSRVAPMLGTGSCLAGTTRQIDW